MKIIYLTTLFLTTVQAAPAIPYHNQVTPEEALIALTKLYEIDIQTKPEDGSVKGIRIRRNQNTQGASPTEEFLLPEIDIEKINDQTLSVNGVRIKRGDLSDLSDVELEKEIQAEASEHQDVADDRSRRSGSGPDTLLGFITGKISQKISAIAGASSSLAGGSSGHNAEPDSYGPPTHTYDEKSFNFWEFKKAILNTLLQAVKAIKGGVIALGGQVIKAKGHLISTAGKIVATKGEAISGFGRHIAANALLSPPAHHGSTGFATGAVDHHAAPYPASGQPSNSYGPPSAPSSGYGAPSSPGYVKRGTSPQQFSAPQQFPNGVQAGLLVLKPINPSHNPYINPRGVQSFGAREDSYIAGSEFKPLPKTVSDAIPSHYGARDLNAGASEPQPVVVNDISNAQSRSYYVRY